VEAITALVDELSGNSLAYALSALQTAMGYDFSWEFPNSFVEKILSLTGKHLTFRPPSFYLKLLFLFCVLIVVSDNTNPNVVKSSLRILCRMCESPKYLFNNFLSHSPSLSPQFLPPLRSPSPSALTFPDMDLLQ
jgi:hypothetical protein